MKVPPTSRVVRWFVSLASAFFFIASVSAIGPGEFSPWMTLSGLNEYMEGLSGHEQDAKNFFDAGNWLTAVEGRWEDGIPQYRVRYDAIPAARRGVWWMWYINQDKQSFDAHVHRLADEGYALVHLNSYVRPGGGERFQGIWHKLIPLTGAPPLPPGRYTLVEIQGKPVPDLPVTLSIEGDRFEGRTPSSQFKGSTRDRYSATVTFSKASARSSELSWQAAEQEKSFTTLMDNVSWKEEEGKIRGVKNGYTVLRFEREK